MTPKQFENWKDFAQRMAMTCFPGTAPEGHPTAGWIASEVESIIGEFREDFDDVTDWDSSPSYVCDRVTEWEGEALWDFFWSYATENDLHWYEVHEEIGCDRGFFGCENPIREEVVDRWSSPVRCCVRAGLDFASSPSAGVLGFTAGDIRRMYPEGVPDWITGGDEKWCPWLQEDHDESECRTFDEMPDGMGIVC